MEDEKNDRWILFKAPESEGNPVWVVAWRSWTDERVRESLTETAQHLTNLEAHAATLEEQLAEERKLRKSLQEDLRQFSTFEQICNSGMLRNFKIDSESDFAQTILGYLQQTMELQINHLRQELPQKRGPEGHLRSA